MPGVKLAALYGIYPHLLGFCGPLEKSETKIILDFLSGFNVPEKKIRKILKEFKGAYFYYKLIAKSNKIKNPFDEKVVRAYWIGNSLLEKVKIKDLKKMIANDFKAEKEIPADKKDEYLAGVLQIKTQIQDFLKNQGVEEIKALGEKFDPNFHEVVGEAEGKESGIIVEEVQKGYKLQGKVIRPAKIKIIK